MEDWGEYESRMILELPEKQRKKNCVINNLIRILEMIELELPNDIINLVKTKYILGHFSRYLAFWQCFVWKHHEKTLESFVQCPAELASFRNFVLRPSAQTQRK